MKVIQNQKAAAEPSHATVGRFGVAISALRSVKFGFGIFRQFQLGKEPLDARIINKCATIVAELDLQIEVVAIPIIRVVGSLPSA